MRCYRRILKITWRDRIRNEDIRKRISGLLGHICRMNDTRLIKHIVFSQMDGKSRRGRPCREWIDDITEWCQSSGQDLFHLAQDQRA